MIKKCFSFHFVLKINFSSDFFGHVGKQLDKKAKVNFKKFNVLGWATNRYNTHIFKVKAYV